MASILLQTNKINRSVRYLSLEESRMHFNRTFKSVRNYSTLALLSFWISPFFCAFFYYFSFSENKQQYY